MSKPTTDQQAVTVAQEDREAAAALEAILRDVWDGYSSVHAIREGCADDSSIVQSFARHRLASVSSASAETLALQAIKAVTATAKDGAAGLSRIMAITNSAGVKAPYSELLQDPAVALIVERPRTEWAHLFKPHATGCAIPPEGWQCSRARGHAGPCAASPEPVPATNQAAPKFSEEWCLKMAELEGNAEIGAGSLDHPLRCPPATNQAEEVLAAVLDQNDAMRQELAHVGNLVSDLARAMRVEQANADGTWPDLAGRIQRLTMTALATIPATSQEGKDASHLQTIDERDALHEALSDAYRAVCGAEPVWSNLFGYNDALDDIREAVAVTPTEPVKEDWRKALQPFADCVEQIDPAESDEEWAKFRLLIGDYRRAAAALATQPATSQEDARGDFGVGQDELVAGFKRALQHPAGDHDGWTDAGMEDAFFRWPVIVNALNEALASNRTATSQEGEVKTYAVDDEGHFCRHCGRASWRHHRVIGGGNFCDMPATPTPPTLSEDLQAALEWYAEQVADCRKIGRSGDLARQALDKDGGERARAALAQVKAS